MEKKTIFISHNWAEKDIAEEIYNDLTSIGIRVIMDNHELSYKDDLKKFMESIRNSDFAILLISDKYLQSKNCLYEVLNIRKEQTFKEKILPITTESAKIYKTNERLQYVSHWESEMKRLESLLENILPINATEAYNDLKIIKDITQTIDPFIKDIAEMLNMSFKDIKKNGYKPILDKIGYDDKIHINELLSLSQIDDFEIRKIELDKYLSKYGPNDLFYSIKALISIEEKQYSLAKFYYEESLKMNSNNAYIYNNLGFVLWQNLKDYDNAKINFERSIELDETLTIARLNLGVLLIDHFDNKEEARNQFEKVISYDPREVKAYNNLGIYYRNIDDYDKAIFYLKQALDINPQYYESHIVLANVLNLSGKKEEGKEIYRKALKLTTNESVKSTILELINNDSKWDML